MANGRLAQSRVGVLGSGEVGRRLATGFSSRGHDVMIGSRDPGSPNCADGYPAMGPASEPAHSPR
ncbi:MAG: NAD(P)-binding domain-containing protein [Solirubrobacteraceae bacterium]